MLIIAGQYSPGTSPGKRLLAHELTHYIQQKSSENLYIASEFAVTLAAILAGEKRARALKDELVATF
jgi:hypothetical protein